MRIIRLPQESIAPKKLHNLRPLTAREWEHELQMDDLRDAIRELQSDETMQASEETEWLPVDEETLKAMNTSELKEKLTELRLVKEFGCL